MTNIKLKLSRKSLRHLIALGCAVLILPGNAIGAVPSWRTAQPPTPQAVAKVPNDQLDSLVAPIALYPDSLLSQTLVASTYPLEIFQLQQWLDKNRELAGHQKRMAGAAATK